MGLIFTFKIMELMAKELEELRDILDGHVECLRVFGRLEKGGREVALVITKIQEARLWANEALREMD